MQNVDRLLMTDHTARGGSARIHRDTRGAAAFVIATGAFNVSRTLRALNRQGLAPPA